jgi:hypothetical protein
VRKKETADDELTLGLFPCTENQIVYIKNQTVGKIKYQYGKAYRVMLVAKCQLV